MKKHFLIFTLILVCVSTTDAQKGIQTVLLEFNKCKESNLDDCLSTLIENLKGVSPDSIVVKNIIEEGNNLLQKEGPTQAMEFYTLAMTKALETNDNALISSVYERYGALELFKGDVEKAYNHHLKALELAEKSGKDVLVNKAKVNLGTTYRIKGDIDKAATNFHEAILGFEKLGLVKEIGYPYMNLGILYGIHGKNESSIENFRKAYSYFSKGGDTLMMANASVNLANTFMSNTQLDSASNYLKIAIETFERYGDVRSIINTETQLGRLYLYQNRWEEAINVVEKATSRAMSQGFIPQVIYNNRLLSEVYIEQNRFDQALEVIEYAIRLGDQSEVNNEYVECLNQAARVHELSSNYKEAYVYEKEARKLEDSLFTIQKKLKIDELEAKFETERKEKEIAELNVLNANAKIDKLNLIWGMALLGLTSILTIVFIYLKNKKDKLLILKERDVEIVNRKNVELENTVLQNNLELKNKELVSSALLISKKKNFLQSLKDVILKKGEKAIHLIDHELESETEWKSFIQVFNQTHNAFIESLNQRHPDLTPNEIRLVCLIKMNMSSKEIATMINISYEGIKKAKYRLKKKLALVESDDLTEYIHQKV